MAVILVGNDARTHWVEISDVAADGDEPLYVLDCENGHGGVPVRSWGSLRDAVAEATIHTERADTDDATDTDG